MKIKVEKWTFDASRSYRIVQSEKCCDKILNSEVIVLNDDYENGDDSDYGVKLERYEHYWDYEDEINQYTYEPIKYCPYCGEKIEINIVNTIDKTEEYLELIKRREELWNKAIKTDSRKKSERFREESYALDKVINELYYSDGLDKINNK